MSGIANQCSVDDCDRPRRGPAGLCNMHRNRQNSTGRLTLLSREDRFWAKVRVDVSGCWIYGNPATYTSVSVGWVGTSAHRYAFELARGPIPDGLQVDHLCRTRGCVHPFHLEPVPLRVNVLRGEGITAVNARKTECIHGHPFDAENTRMTVEGYRECKICRREIGRRHQLRRAS